MSGKNVQVTAYAKVDAAQYGGPKRHSGIPVLVQVVAPPGMGDRAHVDLVAVLDVSCGAMAQASRQSLIEEAMKVIIGKLDNKDRLAIVPVQTSALPEQDHGLKEMTAANRFDAAERVKKLAATGDKKLSKALTEASEILKQRDPTKETNVGFVILISDGDDASIISEKIDIECSVHAFGFRNAHNVKVMHHIATSNSGTYGILNDEHDRITEAFEASISKITSVVAVGTEVEIKCGDGGESSKATLSFIESGRFRSEVMDDRKSGKIKTGALQAGAVRNFIFYVDKVGEADEHDDLTEHFTVRFAYSHPSSSTKEWAEGRKFVVRKGERGSKLVAAEIVRVEAINIVDGILRKYGEQGRSLVDAVEELWQEWLHLRASDYGSEAGEACLISGLDAEIREMVASMSRCSGLSYMLSWSTCHALQHQTRAVSTSLQAAQGSKQAQTPPRPPVPLNGSAERAALQEAICRMGSVAAGGSRKRKDYQRYTELELIEQRLAYWSKVTYELPPMLHDGAGDFPDHITTVFEQASRESIERAMFHDVFLAVVHATERRTGSQSVATESRRPHDPCMG